MRCTQSYKIKYRINLSESHTFYYMLHVFTLVRNHETQCQIGVSSKTNIFQKDNILITYYITEAVVNCNSIVCMYPCYLILLVFAFSRQAIAIVIANGLHSFFRLKASLKY